MFAHVSRFGFFIALFAAVFASAGAPAARGAEKWFRLKSENFDMLSCTSQRESRELLVKLEQFRATFFRFFPRNRAHYKRPLIVVFDKQKQFTPYLPASVPRDVAGIFAEGALESRIVMLNSAIEQGLYTIFHEYVHSIVSDMGLRLPLFANEGLAEAYATFHVSGDVVRVGYAHSGHVLTLKMHDWLPFGDFFSAGQTSKYFKEKHLARRFYAQSWLLMHYMVFGRTDGLVTTGKLDKFISLCENSGTRASMSVAGAFKQAFGLDYQALEAELRDYVSHGRYFTRTFSIPAKPIREKITARPATELERDIELAGLKWQVAKSYQARSRLAQLLESNPGNPRVFEILAGAAIQQDQFSVAASPLPDAGQFKRGLADGGHARNNFPDVRREADGFLRKAVENNSTNPLVYVWLLRSLTLYGQLLMPDYIAPDYTSEEYRRLVDRALELAPDCMEACEMLALIEAQSQKPRIKEVNKVLKALPDMREKTKTLFALASTYKRLGDHESAAAALNRLLADPKATDIEKRNARGLLSEVATTF